MHEISSYEQARKVFGTARDPLAGKPLCNNTRLMRYRNDSFCAYSIRFHATDVVTYYEDGSIELDTGGWFTVTTKNRMNRFLPSEWREPGRDIQVFSERGYWGVITSLGCWAFDGNALTIDAQGCCNSMPWVEKADEIRAHTREQSRANRDMKVERLIRDFLNAHVTWRYGCVRTSGHIRRVPLIDEAATARRGTLGRTVPQALVTAAGKPIAIIWPSEQHATLLEVASDSRSKLWEEVVLRANGVKVALTTQKELEAEMSHFGSMTL